jgi:phosphatidylethanolamine-binding protein (PEBP) family uncharacterized protein
MLTLKPNHGGGETIAVDWAMAGIDPRLHSLAAGEVPAGAHVALTNEGKPVPYSVCPARGQTARYQFALYAVPASISIPSQFVGIKVFEAVGDAESPNASHAGGAFVASYTRPTRRRGRG